MCPKLFLFLTARCLRVQAEGRSLAAVYLYGLVGNCQVSALISCQGSIDWFCLPRPDSEPIFGRLLDPNGGYFAIEPVSESSVETKQYYLGNTNILITEFHNQAGDAFRVTDFCPRFEQFGRIYRPISLYRIVEPISGSPNIRVTCRPVNGWRKELVKAIRGSSHLRFRIREEDLRLTTNMPITYLLEEAPFRIKEKVYFGLTWSVPIQEDLPALVERLYQQTANYWWIWVKHCSIPTLFQKETIRSALALKLHVYEDTGAILAALTTSLPEECGKNRNWDYRYCWLRDAHFVLTAFHNLGQFEEMEGFLKFLLEIAQKHEETCERLAPVYSLSQDLPTPEQIQEKWAGYCKHGPVRTNNQAADHVQNDVYGEMALTLAPIFFDERFVHLRTKDHEELLANLARLCVRSVSTQDAGLWEVRNHWQEHSFTNLMSWAGLERTVRIREAGYLKNFHLDIASARDTAFAAVCKAARDGSLRNGPKDASLDAALALAAVLRFPDPELCLGTVEKIRQELKLPHRHSARDAFFYRYNRHDDFGRPHSAFVICSFWIAQALARLGRIEAAREILQEVSCAANHLGLFSEHFLPETNLQLGNFPQAYSHVGMINAAFAVSPSWSEVL